MAQKVDIVTKIVPKSIGNPKGIGARADDDNVPHVLGLVGGIANKLVMRTMPDGQIFFGLGGQFVGIPFKRDGERGEYIPDTSKNRLSSGVMYLPPGIFEVVGDQLKDADGSPKEGVRVEFLFKLAVIKASNPAGYSWQATPLIETEAAADPLAGILEAGGYGGQEYLPAPDAVSGTAGADGEPGPNADDGSADGKGPNDGATNKVAAKAGAKAK